MYVVSAAIGSALSKLARGAWNRIVGEAKKVCFSQKILLLQTPPLHLWLQSTTFPTQSRHRKAIQFSVLSSQFSHKSRAWNQLRNPTLNRPSLAVTKFPPPKHFAFPPSPASFIDRHTSIDWVQGALPLVCVVRLPSILLRYALYTLWTSIRLKWSPAAIPFMTRVNAKCLLY